MDIPITSVDKAHISNGKGHRHFSIWTRLTKRENGATDVSPHKDPVPIAPQRGLGRSGWGKKNWEGKTWAKIIRIFQHTPGTYPRFPTNSLWFGIPFIWGFEDAWGMLQGCVGVLLEKCIGQVLHSQPTMFQNHSKTLHQPTYKHSEVKHSINISQYSHLGHIMPSIYSEYLVMMYLL